MENQKLEIEKLSKTISNQMRHIRAKEYCRLREFEGFKYVGKGISRDVFAKDDFVLKIETKHSLEHDKQNEKEWKNYKAIPKYLKKYFTKPLKRHPKYRWILSEKAQCKELSYDEKDKIVDQLVKIFLQNMLRYDDFHRDNVGLIQGEPVLVDYGFPLEKITVKDRDHYAKMWSIDLTDSED